MSSKKAETKRNGVKRCREETSSTGSNTPFRKFNTKARKFSQIFFQLSSKEVETKASGVKRGREEISSQGSSTLPGINYQIRKINTRTRKIKNKGLILQEDTNLNKNACGKCSHCCGLSIPTRPTSAKSSGDSFFSDESSGDSSSSNKRIGDFSCSTISWRSLDSRKTTAASKTNEMLALEQLTNLRNENKLNDEEVNEAINKLKNDTKLRDLWLRATEEYQVLCFKRIKIIDPKLRDFWFRTYR